MIAITELTSLLSRIEQSADELAGQIYRSKNTVALAKDQIRSAMSQITEAEESIFRMENDARSINDVLQVIRSQIRELEQ